MNFVTYNVWKASRTHTHTLSAGRPKLAKNALGTARSFKKSRSHGDIWRGNAESGEDKINSIRWKASGLRKQDSS